MALTDNEESPSGSLPSKRLKLDDPAQESSSNNITGLLSLCDVLLLEIFSYLNPTDLLSLSQCCQRFDRVVSDRTLWTRVDFRSTRPSVSELSKCAKFFLPSTTFIAAKGTWEPNEVRVGWAGLRHYMIDDERRNATFTGDLLETIASNAPNLKTLILENHVLDPLDFTLDNFRPRLIEHLTLRCCNLISVPRRRTEFYFKDIDKFLPNLKSLDLSGTYSFIFRSFLALSMCKQLQELCVADCPLDNFAQTMNKATKHGFRALRVVDFRRTLVIDHTVSSLNKIPTLQELYLEAPEAIPNEHWEDISDFAVTAFGGNQSDCFTPSLLRVIHLCNYQGITNTSLRHCASCLKGLTHLNVKGTSCTQVGVLKFQSQRPDVLIESDFGLEVEVQGRPKGGATGSSCPGRGGRGRAAVGRGPTLDFCQTNF